MAGFQVITEVVALMLSLAFVISLCFVQPVAAPASQNADLEANRVRIQALIEQGKIGEALKSLAAIAEQGKNDPDVMLVVGEIFQELAELRADQLLKVAPESAAAHELLGKSLESRGRLEEALVEYQRAVEKQPNAPGRAFPNRKYSLEVKESLCCPS